MYGTCEKNAYGDMKYWKREWIITYCVWEVSLRLSMNNCNMK